MFSNNNMYRERANDFPDFWKSGLCDVTKGADTWLYSSGDSSSDMLIRPLSPSCGHLVFTPLLNTKIRHAAEIEQISIPSVYFAAFIINPPADPSRLCNEGMIDGCKSQHDDSQIL